jgi:hypothetical protein
MLISLLQLLLLFGYYDVLINNATLTLLYVVIQILLTTPKSIVWVCPILPLLVGLGLKFSSF